MQDIPRPISARIAQDANKTGGLFLKRGHGVPKRNVKNVTRAIPDKQDKWKFLERPVS